MPSATCHSERSQESHPHQEDSSPRSGWPPEDSHSEPQFVTLAPCQASWHIRTMEYRSVRAPEIQPRPTAREAPCPGPNTAKARPRARTTPCHAMPRALHPQARTMTHHDSPSESASPRMTHHDSPPGDENPPMTQNDSLCHASNPEMTQNDSLCKASMTQMTQNDSHFEVSSFEMTQNDSFSGLKCPTEHPHSVADEPPATPPSPQNDTLFRRR